MIVYVHGQKSRDFTYVHNIANGTVAGLDLVRYQVISLGSDQPVVLMEVIKRIEELIGGEANVEFYQGHFVDVTGTWADNTKAGKLLAWKPETDLEDGIKILINSYEVNRLPTNEITTHKN